MTGNANASQFGPTLSSAIAKIPVLTSVQSIGANKYTPSHIVTVYGIGAAGNASSLRPLALLNPAVKIANAQRNICEIDMVANDQKWSAILSLESNYRLTSFPQGHLIMWLRKK